MERRAMEDLWSDGPAMEEAVERVREREEDEKEAEAREEKAEASELARRRPRVTELPLDA